MHPGKYARFLTEDSRLCLLRVLTDSPDNRANHYVLQTILGSLGHGVSRDQVCADLAWLAEQGLLRVDCAQGAGCEIMVAMLTSRGEDVAHGRAVAPGVKKPLPGEA